MRSGTQLLAPIAATIGLGMGAAGPAAAGGIVLTTPAGLVPGDTFRVVFLTDGTTLATSSNIDYYNSFVNTQAGSVTYDGQAVTFTAIASTSTVNAIDNIPGSSSAPVYLVNGTEVASSTTTATGGLWSGTIMSPIDLDLAGKTGFLYPVWTGTQASGIGSPEPAPLDARVIGVTSNPFFAVSGSDGTFTIRDCLLGITPSRPGRPSLLDTPGSERDRRRERVQDRRFQVQGVLAKLDAQL